MALSDVIISDLILKQTNTAISESNYHTLRQYLLERKPLLTVTNAINSLLSEHINIEKQKYVQHFTQLACEAQRTNDVREANADEQERINDSLLQESYTKEIPVLERTMSQLEIQCHFQQKHFDQLHRQRHDLKVNLEQVNHDLDRNRNERLLLNNRYHHALAFPQGHIHTHPGTVIYPQPFTGTGIILSLQDQITWDRLLHEENRLNSERQRLTYLIDSRETEYQREERKLNDLLKEKKYTEDRYSEVKKQIEVTLPNKDRERYIRNQDRVIRHTARQNHDPHLQQLSPHNQEALRQLIATQDHAQENQRSDLMNQVIKTSYSVYSSQLELTLQQGGGSKITFSEREALKTIIVMLKSYTEMEQKEQELNDSLHQEKKQLHVMQQKLVDSNEQLKRYITSKPQIIKENERLQEENKQLALDSESAIYHRNNSFYSALAGMGCGLISAGILSITLVSPLLLIIPGACALVAVVSTVIAIVAHCKTSTNDLQIENNKKTISENEATIFNECKKANDISETIIPAINAQIEQIEKVIAELEQELQQQHQAMSQLLHKAQNVTSSQDKNNVFFIRTANTNPQVHSSACICEEPIEELGSNVANFGNGSC